MQHSTQHTLEQCRDPGRKPRACSPTAMLEQMKEHIRNISQDMHILNRSCGEETGAEVRAPNEAGVRPVKQACSDTTDHEKRKQEHRNGQLSALIANIETDVRV